MPVSPRAAILAVDDVPANLLALSAILEPLDSKVVEVRSGAEALAAAAREEFAVILLDVSMPELDGFETLTRLRAIPLARQTPVILVTAYTLDPAAMDRMRGMGSVDYILKPIPPELLRSKVAAMVALHLRGKELLLLNDALSAKDRCIAMLAHDLRNPLSAIGTGAALLQRTSPDPHARGVAERIARGVSRMDKMIGDLTDYARAGLGEIPTTPAPMDVGDLCRELIDEFQQSDSGAPDRARLRGRAGGRLGQRATPPGAVQPARQRAPLRNGRRQRKRARHRCARRGVGPQRGHADLTRRVAGDLRALRTRRAGSGRARARALHRSRDRQGPRGQRLGRLDCAGRDDVRDAAAAATG